MAFSGSISTTTFNALKVVDHAFRRCRLPAQAITSEMHSYALDLLYLALSELANVKTPSWCIQRQIYPFYEGQPVVKLDLGTVEVLNANLRTLQEVTGVTVITPYTYTVDFSSEEGTTTTVGSVGVKWLADAVPLKFEVSDDGLFWKEVGSQTTAASLGEWTWTDILPATAWRFFRVSSLEVILAEKIYLGNMPQEIPMGLLNRDTYVAQSNKIFQGRPLTYWFQRDLPQPVINLWPAPNLAAEVQQLIVWRHRHIMDTENLQQDVEVPQRWLEAIVAKLASKVAAETPSVDMNLMPLLDSKAAQAEQKAWDGDNDGSPTFINPGISGYTK